MKYRLKKKIIVLSSALGTRMNVKHVNIRAEWLKSEHQYKWIFWNREVDLLLRVAYAYWIQNSLDKIQENRQCGQSE